MTATVGPDEAERRERWLRAYYHQFDPTNVGSVDDILEAIAVAGKAYHNTSEWSEPYDDDDNYTHWDAIQHMANRAATYIRDKGERLAFVEEWNVALRETIRDKDGDIHDLRVLLKGAEQAHQIVQAEVRDKDKALVRLGDAAIDLAKQTDALRAQVAELKDPGDDFKKLFDTFVGVVCRDEQAAHVDHLTRERKKALDDVYNHHESKVLAYVASLRSQLTTAEEYAGRLALWLHEKYFKTPGFALLSDLIGRLSQIDHMLATLRDTALEDTK